MEAEPFYHFRPPLQALRPAQASKESERKKKKKAMSGIGPISQDWEPVVIRKKAPNAAAKKDEKAVNAARRSGAEIETIKKCLYSFFIFLALLFFLCLVNLFSIIQKIENKN